MSRKTITMRIKQNRNSNLKAPMQTYNACFLKMQNSNPIIRENKINVQQGINSQVKCSDFDLQARPCLKPNSCFQGLSDRNGVTIPGGFVTECPPDSAPIVSQVLKPACEPTPDSAPIVGQILKPACEPTPAPVVCDLCIPSQPIETITTTTGVIDALIPITNIEQPHGTTSSANLDWATTIARQYNDTADAIVTDSTGSVIIFGTFSTSGSPADVSTIAHNADGQDQVMIVASSQRNGFLVKYDTQGKVLWTLRIENLGEAPIRGLTINVSDEIIIATTGSEGLRLYNSDESLAASPQDMPASFIAKYSAEGTLLFYNLVVNPTLTSIASGPGSEIVVAGFFLNSSNLLFISQNGIFVPSIVSEPDGWSALIAKYTSSGDLLWMAEIGSLTIGDQAYQGTVRVRVNVLGAIYVAADFSNNLPLSISNVIAYNFDGTVSGTLIINNFQTNGVLLASYDTSGNSIWITQIKGDGPAASASVSLGDLALTVQDQYPVLAVNSVSENIGFYNTPNGTINSGIQISDPGASFAAYLVTYDGTGIALDANALFGNLPIMINALATILNGGIIVGSYTTTAPYDANVLIQSGFQRRFIAFSTFTWKTEFQALNNVVPRAVTFTNNYITTVGDYQDQLSILNSDGCVIEVLNNAGLTDAFVTRFYEFFQDLTLPQPVCSCINKTINLIQSQNYITRIKTPCCTLNCDSEENVNAILLSGAESQITLQSTCDCWYILTSNNVVLITNCSNACTK